MPETHNFTDSFSGQNLTEPSGTGPLDAAGCLFVSILPYGQAVPALIGLFVLFTLFSLLVNVVTFLGLARSEELSWQPRFTFLKNLILSDLMQIATFGPPVIHSLVQRRTMAFSTWCYVQYFLGAASIFNSLVTITCMALERYLYVCHAIHYLVILTETRLRRVLTLIWIYSVTVSIVNMVLLHTGDARGRGPVTMGLLCEPDMMEQHMGFPRASAIFRKLTGSLTLLLCLLVHLFSYCRMYQDARNAVIPFNAVNNTARKTVLFYCGMLLLQLLPVLLKVVSDAVWEVRGPTAMMGRSSQAGDVCMVKPTPTATAALLHMSLLMMLIVPPCINPLVYGLRNVEMRQALQSLFQWGAEMARLYWVERERDVLPQNRAQAG